MASLSQERNRGWRITWDDAQGRRVTLRLGPIDKKTAQAIKLHVEHLINAAYYGVPLAQGTAKWLETVGEKLRTKLARLGLAAFPTTLTLKEFLQDYVARRPDVSKGTRLNWNRAISKLVAFFGPQASLAAITPGRARDFAHLRLLWFQSRDYPRAGEGFCRLASQP